MKNTVEYEFLKVIHLGDHFKTSLVLDEYGNQAVCKETISLDDEFALRHLASQAEFLRGSNHPSIANFRDKTHAELYMEAMADDLDRLANASGKRFSAGEAVSFLRQMLNLLSHLNSRGLTIGQLSPRTIFCSEDFSVFKVGMAYGKSAAIPADPNEIIFPPEINAIDQYDVHSSDIYCLGMTCLELILGNAEFKKLFAGMYDDSSDLWIQWHANPHEKISPLTEVLEGFPAGLVEILQKMIAKPLGMRFNSADEILGDLNKLGIVDADVEIARKSNPLSQLRNIGLALVAFMAVAFWWSVPPKSEQCEIIVTTTRDFPYQIVRNDTVVDKGIYHRGSNNGINLNEGDKLVIKKPEVPSQELRVFTGENEAGVNRENTIEVSGLKNGMTVKLVFTTKLRTISNQRFAYQIIRGAEEMKPQGESDGVIDLQDDDELTILPPDSVYVWQLSINADALKTIREPGYAIAWTDISQLDLKFTKKMRSIELKSQYEDFVWKIEKSDSNASSFKDHSTIEFAEFATKKRRYVLLKPNKPGLLVKSGSVNNDGWFKVSVNSYQRTLDVNFVQPIELEMTGYHELSDELLRNLDVRVGGQKLKLESGVFKADILYSSASAADWTTSVTYHGETLFNQRWNEFSTESDSQKTARLHGKVNVTLQDGFMIREVNGQTGFDRSAREVTVPFGNQLDMVVADASGVIEFRDSLAWTQHAKFDVAKFLQRKRLRNENGHAKFVLRQLNRPEYSKEFSSNETAFLPRAGLDTYRVVVEWPDGIAREFSLEQFMKFRKPVEKYGSNTIAKARQPNGVQYAVSQLQAGN